MYGGPQKATLGHRAAFSINHKAEFFRLLIRHLTRNEQINLFTHTVGAAPFALGSLLQLGLQAHQVVRSGAGVTQDDLSPLLADLAVVLVVGLVAVAILLWGGKDRA